MKLPQLLLFRILFCYVLGILSYPFWEFPFKVLVSCQGILLLGCILFKKRKLLFWVCTLVFFWTLGIGMQFANDDSQKNNYYQEYLSTDAFYVMEGIVEKVLKPSPFNSQYEFQLHTLNQHSVVGKLLLSLKNDSLNHNLQVDDRLRIVGRIQKITSSKNPYQFDYAEYMRKQGIEHRINIQKAQLNSLPKNKQTWRGMAYGFREYLISKLEKQGFQSDNESVIKALVLGDRTDISTELKRDYADARALHLLAISGLHIGVLLLLLNGLFSPLLQWKHGGFVRLLLVVSCLWIFAFITGLSASVMRSVTMFSAVALGIALKRSKSQFQTLLISLFVLLLIRPNFIYDVGFQLSYLAVFGILWLMPVAMQFWKPRWWIVMKIWQLIALGTIAQLCVLPLSLYYFHQFPLLFLVANLVIVPFMGLLLGGGVLVVLVSALNINIPIIIKGYDFLMSFMNGLIYWVADQDTLVIRNIPFGTFELICVFVGVLGLGLWLEKPNQRKIFIPLLAGCILIGGIHYQENQKAHQDSLWIFHRNRQTIIAQKKGIQLRLYQHKDSIKNKLTLLENFKMKERIQFVDTVPHRNVFLESNLLVVDEKKVIIPIGNQPPNILLTQSPKIHLKELIDSLKPQKIIADGSNYPTLVRQWEETCKREKISFHNTYTDGPVQLAIN
jgi:competence protein ComEC